MSPEDLTSKEKRIYDKFSRIAERRHVSDERGVQEVVEILTSPSMKAIPVIFFVIGISASLLTMNSLASGETPTISGLIALVGLWAGAQNYHTIRYSVPKIADAYIETLEPKRLSKKKRKRLAQQEAQNDH